MPTHYCDGFAGVNGDGTFGSPFNDVLACLDGTQAGIADGDTVIFRTHNGTNNLQVTWSASFTILGGAAGSKRTYIMDDGTAWAGNAGVLELNTSTDTVSLKFGARAIVLGGDFRLQVGHNAANLVYVEYQDESYFDGLLLKQLNTTAQFNRLELVPDVFNQNLHLGRVKVELTKLPGNNTQMWGLSSAASNQNILFDAYIYEFTAKPAGSGANYGAIHGIASFPHQIEIMHMEMNNVPNDFSVIDNSPANCTTLKVHNFVTNNADYEFRLVTGNTELTVELDNVIINGVGMGQANFIAQRHNITTSWLSGKNYPTLNTFLPDDATKWSIKADFEDTESFGNAKKTSGISAFYSAADAAKTLSVEILVKDTFVTPQADEFFVVFTYIDSTNVVRQESTLVHGSALTTSAAAWDTTNYGPIDFDKYKLSLTTSNAIKQNTFIMAETFINADIPDASAFNFINPQIDIT